MAAGMYSRYDGENWRRRRSSSPANEGREKATRAENKIATANTAAYLKALCVRQRLWCCSGCAVDLSATGLNAIWDCVEHTGSSYIIAFNGMNMV